jgi:hypothetical protein
MRNDVAVPGRRYLTASEAVAALSRGSQIEQFLGSYVAPDGRSAVRWLSAFRSGRTFKVVIHDVEDVGTDDFGDLSAFPPLDDDEYSGEGRSLITADDAHSLIGAAAAHGADSERWVNGGMVQDEYLEQRTPL